MTRVHPILKSSRLAAAGLEQQAFDSVEGVSLLFFEPTAACIASHAKGARQAAQTAALFVSTQYFILFVCGVAIGLWVGAATASAVRAQIALFAVGGAPVMDELFAATMGA